MSLTVSESLSLPSLPLLSHWLKKTTLVHLLWTGSIFAWLSRARSVSPDWAELRGHADMGPMKLISELTFH